MFGELIQLSHENERLELRVRELEAELKSQIDRCGWLQNERNDLIEVARKYQAALVTPTMIEAWEKALSIWNEHGRSLEDISVENYTRIDVWMQACRWMIERVADRLETGGKMK